MKMKRRPHYYNVMPRYSSGSPAQVDVDTACKVAISEKRSYEAALEGVYGEAQQERAERLGLRGIAEGVREVRKLKGWEVTDLLTCEVYVRPFCDRMRQNGFTQWRSLKPHVQELLVTADPHLAEAASRDSRNIWFRHVDTVEFFNPEGGYDNPLLPSNLTWEPQIEKVLS